MSSHRLEHGSRPGRSGSPVEALLHAHTASEAAAPPRDTIPEDRAAWRQERRHRREAIATLRRRALECQTLADVLHEAMTVARGVLRVEFAKVLVDDAINDSLTVIAAQGWTQEITRHVVANARGNSQAGYALRSGAPVVVEDLRRVPVLRDAPVLREHGVVGGASVIVRGQHQPFGVLSVHTTKRRMLAPDELAFLLAVADLIAAAVYRFSPAGPRRRVSSHADNPRTRH